jgi:nitrate reductase delta subunit
VVSALKVLAVLLSYPDINVYKNIDELAEALKQESLLSKKTLICAKSTIAGPRSRDSP